MKKKFMTLALTAAMAASMGMTAFAGQWVQNTTGWWWQEDNGSYPVSQWKWLDGNNGYIGFDIKNQNLVQELLTQFWGDSPERSKHAYQVIVQRTY